MIRCITRVALAALASLTLVSASADAHAGTRADCGNIELLAVGECHLEFAGGCRTKCEPIRFVAACDGQCDAQVDVACTSSCQADCKATCEVEPAEFQCAASCKADCGAQVAMECGDDQECVAYCETACAANCDADCGVVAPSASCESQCQASCGGSCETAAEFECSYTCSGEIQGGCEADCDAPEGALFCDGQYIAVSNFPGCLEYLADSFEIHVEVRAEAHGEITGCATAPGGTNAGLPATALVLAGAGILVARRRRRG